MLTQKRVHNLLAFQKLHFEGIPRIGIKQSLSIKVLTKRLHCCTFALENTENPLGGYIHTLVSGSKGKHVPLFTQASNQNSQNLQPKQLAVASTSASTSLSRDYAAVGNGMCDVAEQHFLRELIYSNVFFVVSAKNNRVQHLVYLS